MVVYQDYFRTARHSIHSIGDRSVLLAEVVEGFLMIPASTGLYIQFTVTVTNEVACRQNLAKILMR